MKDVRSINSSSLRRYRRQRFYQIILPVCLVSILVLSLAFLIIGSENSQTRLLADVSIIWLIAPLLAFALMGVVALCVLIYTLTRLMLMIPKYTNPTQKYANRLRTGVMKGADILVKPLVWLQQISALLKSLLK